MLCIAVAFSTLFWGAFVAGFASPLYLHPVAQEPCVWEESSDTFYTAYMHGYFPLNFWELEHNFPSLSSNDCADENTLPLQTQSEIQSYIEDYYDDEEMCILSEDHKDQAVVYKEYGYVSRESLTGDDMDSFECLGKTNVPTDIWANATDVAQKDAESLGWDIVAFLSIMSFYALIIASFIIITFGVLMAHIRLNAVQLSEKQYPKFYQMYRQIALQLGIKHVPPAYIIDQGGDANAFAVKIIRRRMVVFFAELVERLVEEEKYDELRAIAAHELTHVKLKHIQYHFFLLPFTALPFIGAWFSRMRELSADRGALFVVKDVSVVSSALIKLVAGTYVAKKVDVDEYIHQAENERGFFVLLAKLYATHPPIPFRIRALKKISKE